MQKQLNLLWAVVVAVGVGSGLSGFVTNDVIQNHKQGIEQLQKELATIKAEKASISIERVQMLEKTVKDLEYRLDLSEMSGNQKQVVIKEVVKEAPKRSVSDKVNDYRQQCDQQKNQLHYELFNMPAPGCDF